MTAVGAFLRMFPDAVKHGCQTVLTHGIHDPSEKRNIYRQDCTLQAANPDVTLLFDLRYVQLLLR